MNFGFDPQSVLDTVNQNVTRPYMYNVNIRLPDVSKDYIGLMTIDTIVKSSSLPKLSVDSIDLKYKGRTIKIPNKLNYPGTWTCTFYLDDTYFVREAMEKWMFMFDRYYDGANISFSVTGGWIIDKKRIISSATVTQYSKFGTGIQEYNFQGLFPISIEEVPLADDRVGSVNEFSVTFAYSYYGIGNGSNILGSAVKAAGEIAETATGIIDSAIGFGQAAGKFIGGLF